MTRAIRERLILTGQLVAITPLAIGGAGAAPGLDLPLALDGEGRIYAPGSSLAGPLRAWTCETFNPREVDSLWGASIKKRVRGDEENQSDGAGLLYIEDARLDGAAAAELRDHVGIDRVEGRACPRIKFERQIAPIGTRFDFQMAVDVTDGGQSDLALESIATLAVALESGWIRFGAAQTRGLGEMALEQARLRRVDLGSKAGVLAHLRGRRAGEAAAKGADQPEDPALGGWRERARNPPPILELLLRWEPKGPLAVGGRAGGVGFDHLPLTTSAAGAHRPVLPGASIKGAVRSLAERIMATLAPREEAYKFTKDSDAGPELRFRTMLDEEADSLVTALFGVARRSEPEEGEDEAEPSAQVTPSPPAPRPGRAALAFPDIVADTDAELEAKLPRARTAELDHELLETPPERLSPAMSVAIDRWTGGAAKHRLFARLELWPEAGLFPPIRILVDVRRLAANADPVEALALLFLTLREAARGGIGFGGGVTRGSGAVVIHGVTVRLRGGDIADAPELDWLNSLLDGAGEITLSTLTDPRLKPLAEAWKTMWSEHAE